MSIAGYKVAIRGPSGEVRVYNWTATEWSPPDDLGTGDLFWWTQGNGGCDCNLASFYQAAASEDDLDIPCGHTYKALYAILPDGSLVDIEEYGDWVKHGIKREVRTRPEQFADQSGGQV